MTAGEAKPKIGRFDTSNATLAIVSYLLYSTTVHTMKDRTVVMPQFLCPGIRVSTRLLEFYSIYLKVSGLVPAGASAEKRRQSSAPYVQQYRSKGVMDVKAMSLSLPA